MNWTVALPEIVLACSAMGILVFGVLRRQDPAFLCTMLSVGALILTGTLVLSVQPGGGYGGQFVVDNFATFMKLLAIAGAALSIVLSLDYNDREGMSRFEFPVLALLSTLGMMVMCSAANLMTLYLGLELMSLALYVLCAFHRDDARSAEAGLKYFILSSLASGLILYGISLAYGYAGTMQFGELTSVLARPGGASPGLIVGVVFIIAGLAFKLSAVPFHMWTPDVYEGAPTPVTTFLSTGPKVAAFALFLRVLEVPFGPILPQWSGLIVLVSLASMILGALGAIGQRNIKRLMAYSSIGHMGYALVGLAVGTQDGIRGVMIYLVTYVFMSAGAFAVLIAMRRRGRSLEQIADLSGLGNTDPALALMMTIFMFSMAGIPPFSGFFGKLYVFRPAVESGYWTLAVVGVLTSVVASFYYLRVIKVMYFDRAESAFDPRATSITFVGGVGALVTTFFFVFPAPIVGAAQQAARVLFG
ncbi:MAG: NADH-quinone oxidoreductase subunit NuoN [Acetobacteraceae bacterium]|nr:NADH-quinone oxidoreductase subunit NuoN [Acetobacteraceae bacterium]